MLARLLTPSEYGIMAIITIFIAISTSIVDSGFSNALIRKTDARRVDYNTVFFFNLVVSAALYVVLYLAAPAISRFFREPLLVDVMRVISWILVINALAIQSAIEERGMSCRVMSSINVPQVAEAYIRRKATSHLSKGIVTIFAGGTGNPFFTTDSTATLRALEVGADAILMAKNGVDGVYDSDPRKNKDAKLIKHLTFHEVVERKLQVMDLTAVAMLEGKSVVIRVFDFDSPDSFLDVLEGKDIGTIISEN